MYQNILFKKQEEMHLEGYMKSSGVNLSPVNLKDLWEKGRKPPSVGMAVQKDEGKEIQDDVNYAWDPRKWNNYFKHT